MSDEEKANIGKTAGEPDPLQELQDELAELDKKIKLEEEQAEEPRYEEVHWTKAQLRALPDEVYDQHTDVLRQRVELDDRLKELNRKAFKLGLLRLADQTPRCSHMKSNGRMCRAPAVRDGLFCIFHQRAIHARDHARIEVLLPEDRQSVQLTLKQVMDHVACGRIDLKTASLLLRGLQVANSILRPRRVKAERKPRRKPPKSYEGEDNPEENSA